MQTFSMVSFLQYLYFKIIIFVVVSVAFVTEIFIQRRLLLRKIVIQKRNQPDPPIYDFKLYIDLDNYICFYIFSSNFFHTISYQTKLYTHMTSYIFWYVLYKLQIVLFYYYYYYFILQINVSGEILIMLIYSLYREGITECFYLWWKESSSTTVHSIIWQSF